MPTSTSPSCSAASPTTRTSRPRVRWTGSSPSHFEPAQGANFSSECGLEGAEEPSTCVPEYQGNLQPFAVYVPPGPAPAGGYGLTLLLHSLSANYNQYLGSRNQSEFGDRTNPSIVITPEARGPDQEYEGLGAADVFEAWAEIASLYPLNPAYTDITGYSMGGIGTFKLGAQFPDLFARAQPTVGFETNNDVLASLRNLPVLMWNVSSDELVNASDYAPTAAKLASLGYRYELDVYQPCANSLCSPVLANHLMLGINDQFAPAAAFLGSATVDLNPAHVTYVVDTARDRPSYGIVGDHAYWVSGLTLRSPTHTSTTGDPEGEIDVFSHGFGTADPIASGNEPGTGTLTGGNMGPLAFASLSQTWGAGPPGTGERHARRHRDQYRDRLDRRLARACGLWRPRQRHDRRADHDRPDRLQPHDPSRLAPSAARPVNTTGTP